MASGAYLPKGKGRPRSQGRSATARQVGVSLAGNRGRPGAQVEVLETEVGQQPHVRQVHRAVGVEHHDPRARPEQREHDGGEPLAAAHVEDQRALARLRLRRAPRPLEDGARLRGGPEGLAHLLRYRLHCEQFAQRLVCEQGALEEGLGEEAAEIGRARGVPPQPVVEPLAHRALGQRARPLGLGPRLGGRVRRGGGAVAAARRGIATRRRRPHGLGSARGAPPLAQRLAGLLPRWVCQPAGREAASPRPIQSTAQRASARQREDVCARTVARARLAAHVLPAHQVRAVLATEQRLARLALACARREHCAPCRLLERRVGRINLLLALLAAPCKRSVLCVRLRRHRLRRHRHVLPVFC